MSMVDLHTHILPGMDDGAPDTAAALQMLRMEAEQGVDTVALTPHFYRNREYISDFLLRRADAMERLRKALQNGKYPRLILSAEVAYMPGMADWPELEEFCYAGTKFLLVELPVTAWNDEMFRQLYAIEGRRGITPMIAHAERYFRIQTKARMEQLLDTGFPVQVSTAAFLRFRGRRRALKLLTGFNAVLVTDCHNTTVRPPDMDAARRILEKKLGSNVREILRMPMSYISGETEGAGIGF